ncbi:hypothetical protein U1Q18_052453 [Sarracenia purpurea var. burkii]
MKKLLLMLSYASFRTAGILDSRIVRQPINISGFRNQSHMTLGHVRVDLVMGPSHSVIKFHIIERDATYHALFTSTWLHRCDVVPSTYHQCMKAIWNNKVVNVVCSQKVMKLTWLMLYFMMA